MIIDSEIPFNKWSRERIKFGKKVCTSRKKIYDKDPRVHYISPKLPWWLIKNYLWQPEGANSPTELQIVIDKIFRRKVEDDEEFYVHFGDFKEKS